MSRSTLLTLVLAALSIVPACTRKLDDQPCPCTEGWTCCVSQNRCLPAGVPGMCPGDDRTPVVLPGVCTADGWCGATQPITGLSGSADDDIWMVVNDLGASGSALPMHFDGTKWSALVWNPSDVQVGSVFALWGTGRNDVFAAGSGGIVHFNGSSWVQVALGYWYALGGSSATDVWAVGGSSALDSIVVGHYDGAHWTEHLLPGISNIPLPPTFVQRTSVWAASPTDAWIVSAGGALAHWDGSKWDARPLAIDGERVTEDLLAVWGSSERDVWIAARPAALFHFDGSVWSRPNAGAAVDLSALGATGGFHAVWGTGPRDVWFAGDGGVLLHWDGGRWTAAPSGTTQSLNALWESPRGDLWAAGDAATVVHGLGDNWSTTPPAPFKGLPVTSIRGNSQSDIWVAGTGIVSHFDGKSWSACPAQDGWRFEKIQVMGPGVAMMVGSGVGMRQYSIVDGACQVTGSGSGTTMDMHDIWANAPNDIWAVGAQGTTEHFDGAKWSDVPTPTTADVIAVWGSPTDELGEPVYVLALTGGDSAIRWDGTSWKVLSPLTGINPGTSSVSWTMITGTASYDAFLFGVYSPLPGSVLGSPISRHWNGTSWSRTVPDDYSLTGGDDAWNGVGGLWIGGPTVFRLGSLGWTSVYTGYPGEQISIWGDVVGPVWVLGRDGSLMRGPSGN